jgi:FlaA1/EpsC-like NDP-sugar epimerase
MKLRLPAMIPAYVALYGLSYYAAYLLRFDFNILARYADLCVQTLPVVILFKLLTNFATGEWRRVFRYTAVADIFVVFVGATISAGLVFAWSSMRLTALSIPRSIILIDWGLTILAGGLLRMSVRLFCEQFRAPFKKRSPKRTLIYRSSEEAVGILRTLQATGGNFRVAAFVDDNPRMNNSLIAGVPVYPAAKGWKHIARKTRARHILIPNSTPGRVVRELVQKCAEANLRAHVVPTVPELVDGRQNLTVRDVTISDLLRREPTQFDFASIRKYVSNKRVLVTGAAGSIGSELCRQIIDLNPASLVLVDQSEYGVFTLQQELLPIRPDVPLHFAIADVANQSLMERVFSAHRPQLVFHAAAYKHVPLMEENPSAAIRNNVGGSRIVADLSAEFNVERFILISTDKAMRPSNVMGATKLIAEKYVQANSLQCSTQFISVRFGNVLNSAGSVVQTFRKQIAAGGPVTVTHPDMERFFMTIPEAVQLVLQAGAVGGSGDVLLLEMGDPVKIVDLAKDMIHLSGLSHPGDINIVFTGIRPGEKLREDLFDGVEKGTVKVHDKIYSAPRKAPLYDEIRSDIDHLLDLCDRNDDDVARELHAAVAKYSNADCVSRVLESAA